jgi:EmrB/QacA subfamily drug resistance transporter
VETDNITRPIGLRSLPRQELVMTFVGVMLAMLLGSLDQTVVGTAMPRIIADLGGFSHYTWVTTAYIIASAVTIPITGRLTDMYGRKFFYIAGLIIFLMASFACGLSYTMTQIVVFRGIQGIGAGIMMANAFTVIGDLFPPAERGKYQGLVSGVFGLSSIIGPALGGFITDTLSWHWVFFINIPFGIAVILIFLFFFPHLRPDTRKHKIDFAGVTTLIMAVVPAMLALTWGGVEYPWGSAQIMGMFAFSALMLASFILIERSNKEPIIPLGLFNNRVVTVSALVIFLTGFGMFGAIIFTPLFFQGVLGTTATTSGSFLTPMMLGIVGGSLISGQLLSRTGGHYRLQGIVGISVMALGMGLLSRMNTETSYATAVVNISATGFGLGITMPLYTIAIQNAVPYNLLGVATSSSAFFRSIGGSVGLAVMGSVMNNRFASGMAGGLPATIKAMMPAQALTALSTGPQALVSPEAQRQLKTIMERLGPQGVALHKQLLQVLKQSLGSALSKVFFVGLLVLVVAFIVNLFIREIPLRKQHVLADSTDDRIPERSH